AGQVSRANVATTAVSDDSLIGDIDPDHAHSWWSIKPYTTLPAITDPVVIDGYSQFTDLNNNGVRDPGEPGATPNTLGIGPDSPGHTNGDGTNAVLRIELDGSNGGSNPLAIGLRLNGGKPS